ncbi:hypothetical protein OH456_06635 [Vibrio sp. La 4.2.2]|uniref:hypothetical protein n=1 Tax=Vibrio sp. La 4.2.2 TaxID=2998830 RepID=UPI0022CDFCFC|nr:hypothetical protein [Vibrio sp. La 4.2.2]MDA0107811.1 hypothetical protein [Vibrio sp. La 4.2.2]
MPNSKRFFDLIKNCPAEVEEEDNILRLSLPASSDLDTIELAAKEFGFLPRSSIVRNSKLELLPNKLFWDEGESKYYVSYEKLLKEFFSKGKIITGSLVYNSETKKVDHITNNSPLKKQLDIVKSFIELLVKLSDQSLPDSGFMEGFEKTVFFIKTDETANKYEVGTSLTWQQLNGALPSKLDDLMALDSLVSVLISKVTLGDAQDAERKNCMRSALDTLMSKASSNRTLFYYLLSRIEDLNSTYNDHHNMFLSEFSVNKVIQEIAEKDLEYITKINEFTSSAQTKALAIPGAMVAIAAILKTNSSFSAFGVMMGLVLTAIIIDRCLSIYKSSFLHIDKHIKNVFKQYEHLAVESKVRSKAEKTKSSLLKLNTKAKLSLEFIRGVVWVTVIVAGIFLVTQNQLRLDTDTSSSVNVEQKVH